MIQIKNKQFDILAQYLYSAIYNYLKGRTKKNAGPDLLNSYNKYFSGKYSFEEIVTARPEKLEEIVIYWDDLLLKHKKSKKKKIKKEFIFLKNNIYNYFSSTKSLNTSINGNKIVVNAKWLMNQINIHVCPYCNRNFIYNTEDIRTCEFDHYYPKDLYPFLAISFWNLIPSCKLCNFLKNNDNRRHYHPYDERFQFDDI